MEYHARNNVHTFAKDKRVMFKMEYQNTPPGYVLLRIHSNDQCDPVFYESIEYALVFSRRYLSSDKFVKKNEDLFFQQTGYVAANTKYTEHNGPSLPKKVFNTNEVDFVRAFPANFNGLTETWFNRSRLFNWPSKETQTEITSLPIYVVPVGKLESENRDLQWRISFTPAEIHLVHSLNDTQTKLLVCLRLLCKHIFSPICSTMSSYLMKNVVFWLSEQNPLQHFDEHRLFDRLIDALLYIQNGIRRKHISNYMIMERNLLEGKLLDRSIRRDLDKAIADVIEQLPETLLMCMRYYHDKDSLQLMLPNLY
ncbi:uncharacterized protein LOC132719962 [Ruditapes philippinarum]|uniref:uncharacterized protein LOC132719962 n=1 Tax=Ruditapes philippinarum TaxID=129788 RepID=UPI00295B3A9F|nr:uncharacterized protein LOC132719962 [Ruditapes philippinarum]XP_060559912.1 uncharacterized protein LOC132719962 [Ruditapes philippinarum]